MDQKRVNIWYDTEGDFLEVVWEKKSGDFVKSKDGRTWVKLDDEGNILGFQIQGISKIKKPLNVSIEPEPEEEPAGSG
ncbi:MAG: DUF2283 domain-containing protein [Dehalococcoidia bacterium]